MFPVIIENAKLKLAPAITVDAPITVANGAIEISPLVAIKQSNPNQNCQKQQYIY